MGSAFHVITYRHLITVRYVSQSLPGHHIPKARLILQSKIFCFWYHRLYANKLLLRALTPGVGQRIQLICKYSVVVVCLDFFLSPPAWPMSAGPALCQRCVVPRLSARYNSRVNGARQTIAVILPVASLMEIHSLQLRTGAYTSRGGTHTHTHTHTLYVTVRAWP